jgi:hypothetical protein
MKTRPKKLVVLAAFLMIMACSFPIQVMALYGHTPLELSAIAGKLAPLNWAVMLLAPITAVMAYNASPWLLAALPALTALVFYNNWLVGSMSTDYGVATASLASAGFVIGMGMLLNRDALQVVLNPTLRWWMTPARKRLALPVRFKLLSNRRTARKSEDVYDEFYVKTYDLSEGGVFIPADQPGQLAGTAEARNLQVFATILRSLAIGTQCYVCLPLKDVTFIQCRAEIVRNTPGRGGYPAGVGLRFLGLSRGERKKLQRYLESVRPQLPQAQQATAA